MSTPNSQPSSYLAPSDFLVRYDARTVGDLCSDTGTRVTPAALLTNPNLQAALDDASGEVESAVLIGNRYQPGDLAGLTGVSQKYLWRIIGVLAMAHLVQRRPDLKRPLPPQYDKVLLELESLRQGERIFALQEVQNAGLGSAYQELAGDVEARDLIVTQARRFFGQRVNQDPGFPQ